MRRLAGLLGACALAACGGAAGPGPPDGGDPAPDGGGAEAALSVERASWRLDLRTGALHVDLAARLAPPGGSCVRLRSDLPVAAAAWDGRLAFLVQEGGWLRLCGPAPVAGAATLSFDLALLEGRVPGTDAGFWRAAEPGGGRFTFLTPWLEGCGRLGPCAPGSPLLEAEVVVLHDPAEVVLCAGERSEAPGETRCRVRTPAASYSAFTVAARTGWSASTFLAHPRGRVVFHETAQARLSPLLSPADVGNGLTWLTDLLGPLPFGEEVRVGVGPLSWLGYEPPANIFLSESLPVARTGFANPVLHTLLHELAHQWAGDRTAPAAPVDAAWKEALAEYLAYRVELAHRPPGEAEATRREWARAGLFSPCYPEPLDAPLLAQVFQAGYTSAPMALLVQLEDLLGEEAVLAAVAGFLAKPAARATGELQDELEAASGRDLRTYWQAWVRGSGEPARPELVARAEGAEVVVEQQQAGPPMPLAVTLELVEGGRRARVQAVFDLVTPPRSVRVRSPLPGPPERILIDPDQRLLDLPVR